MPSRIGLLALVIACGCPAPTTRTTADGAPPDATSDAAPAASDPTAAFYDPQVVQRIELEIGAAELQAMHDALPERVYVRGTFRWGDVELRDVGVRYKGNSSSQPQQRHKRSFLIKFGEYVDGQRFLGLRRVALDNGVQFGSLFSERILGDVLRELDVIVSRSNYATLRLNGEFLGVYVNVERIDRAFLDRNFDDPRGNLYKADTGGPGSDLVFRGDDPALYARAFEPKTNDGAADHQDIVQLLRQINLTSDAEFSRWLDVRFDAQGLSRMLPVLLLGGAFDQYTGFNAHNYYLYHEPSADRWTYLLWDVDVGFADNAFGRVPVIDGWDASYPLPASGERPLIQRMIDDPQRLAAYRALAAEVLERFFRPVEIDARIDALYAQIAADLQRDPFPPGRITVPSDQTWEDTIASLKAFARRRHDTAVAQLASPASAPPPIEPPPGPEPAPGPPSPQDPSDLRIEAASAAGVALAWTDNSDDEAAFIIQKCGGSGCADFENAVGLPGQDITRGTDPGVSPGATYRYRVYAMRPGIGGSGPSNAVQVMIP